jgi:hypothetical protein
MTPGQRIDQLDRRIQDLRIEYERFLSGNLETPPEALRRQIAKELRELRNSNLKGVEENFRLSNSEARFNSFCELYSRRVRTQEEGAASAAAHRGAAASAVDPTRGLVVDGAVADEAVTALYQRLHRGTGAQPRFDLESFRTYLNRQLATIREKTGCDRVVFRIAEEDGRMKLRAKPVRPT